MKFVSFALIAFALAGCQSTAPEPVKKSDLAESPQQLAAEAGIPLYPNADMPEGKSNIKSTATGTRYEIVMAAHASEEEVLRFYKDKLNLTPIPDTKSLMGTGPGGELIKIDLSRKGDVTEIDAVSIKDK
jgi:hypothetical protein